MNLKPFSPMGTAVEGVSLDAVTATTAPSLRRLLATYGVVVLSHQEQLEDDAFGALLRTIGLAGTTAGPPVAGLQSPTGRPPELRRGSDRSVFSDQHRAFETLPDDIRDWLLGRSLWCAGGPPQTGPESKTQHPLFRRHPLTGRVVLHLPSRVQGLRISGLPNEVAAAAIGYLVDHSIGAENALCHQWSPGDVLLWDSWSVRYTGDRATPLLREADAP